MAIQSSFPKIADQIVNYNKNVVDILSKINQLVTSSDTSLTVNVSDSSGILRQFNLPTVGFLKSEIDRLNNNINSIYSINNPGTLVATVNGTKFRKVVTVDLNKEPNDISRIDNVTSFKSSKNWFFDGLLNPQISVEINLANRVSYNVRKILCRRYIVRFEKNSAGNFTTQGQQALDSFNLLFRGKNDFSLGSFLNWHTSTLGVANANSPDIDEQMFDLEPNFLELDGTFTVLSTYEDTINNKLFYNLNSLLYVRNQVDNLGQIVQNESQLVVGDEVILNTPNSFTRYKILEILTGYQNPRVRFERIEGNEPIPTGVVGALKVYSPVIYNKRVRISFGYDERNVVFIKALNMDTFILSKNWSDGMGFYSNDLFDTDSGDSLPSYYTSNIIDYGELLKDLANKKQPNSSAGKPSPPNMSQGDFQVKQINRHATESADANLLQEKSNQQQSYKSQLSALFAAINDKKTYQRLNPPQTEAQRATYENELKSLQDQYTSLQSLSRSLNDDILSLSSSLSTKISAKYSVRGFFPIPDAVVRPGGRVQEIIQFKIQYRYLTSNGQETPVETFTINRGNTTEQVAAFSNWIEIMSPVRQRAFNAGTGKYTWLSENVANPSQPNINQIDIPIQSNERVEIRVKSISEVGWPESPVESDWSQPFIINFPDQLNTVATQNETYKEEAKREDLLLSVKEELTVRGYDTHIDDQVSLNNITFKHTTEKILSGFRNDSGVQLSLFEYLTHLQGKIQTLEDKINKVKGELEVIFYRQNEEYTISNGSELEFNIECEDFLSSYTSPGVPTGRVYKNDIYVIKIFQLKIRNKSTDNILGLRSKRNYNSTDNGSVLSSSAPQVFWVDRNDELIVSDVTGSSKTQIDNQFIWAVNYDGLNETTAIQLSKNIGNEFQNKGNNSIIPTLSSTEYNIGFSELSILKFVSNNKFLTDREKWIQPNATNLSSSVLLSSIHPVISSLENIRETNTEKVFSLKGGSSNDINIPIHIYFKMNALDNNKEGQDYTYINLNSNTKTIKHIKKLKFLLENDNDNAPFVFTLKFTLNRAKLIVTQRFEATPNNNNNNQS